jgi:hypothetical protein
MQLFIVDAVRTSDCRCHVYTRISKYVTKYVSSFYIAILSRTVSRPTELLCFLPFILNSDTNNKEHIFVVFSGTEGAASYSITSVITCGTITIKCLVSRHKFVHFRVQRAVVSVAGSVTEVTWFNNRRWDRYTLSPSQPMKDAFHSVKRFLCCDNVRRMKQLEAKPPINELWGLPCKGVWTPESSRAQHDIQATKLYKYE